MEKLLNAIVNWFYPKADPDDTDEARESRRSKATKPRETNLG
jgi:hypothetical protein